MDAAILLIPRGFLLGLVGIAMLNRWDEAQTGAVKSLEALALVLVVYTIGWPYYAFLESSRWQGTVGKRLRGLKISDMRGQRIGLGQASLRFFAGVLPIATLGMGIATALVNRRNQMLHDYLSRCLVTLDGGVELESGEAKRAPTSRLGQSLRWAAVVLVGVAVLFLGIAGWGAAHLFIETWRDQSSKPPVAGEAEFDQANRQISSFQGNAGLGNTPQAAALASDLAAALKPLRGKVFQGDAPLLVSLSKDEFLTWCELREGSCTLLVHVPEFRAYSSDAQVAQAKLAWSAAQELLRARGFAPPMRLAMGLRGTFLYGPIWSGELVEVDSTHDGVTFSGGGVRDMKRLYPFFAPSFSAPFLK
jgi:uncharacterized RDD family membrane protein YckC